MYMSLIFAGQKGSVRQELQHQGKVTVLTHKGIENPVPLFLILKYHKVHIFLASPKAVGLLLAHEVTKSRAQ